MHFFKFHIGDYRQATMHLTNEEDLAYRRLLEMYYDTEQPIPTDIPWVSRRLRLDSKSIESVLNDFFTLTEHGWVNHRADQEIAEYHAWTEKQKANGSKGGRPKKTQVKPTANPVLTQKKPNQKPLTTNHKPETQHPPTPLEEGESDVIDISREVSLAKFLRPLGVNVTSMHPTLCQWVNAGITDTEAQEAVIRARQNKPPPALIPPGYLDPIIAQVLAEREARMQTTKPSQNRRSGDGRNEDFDNSAPGKVRRAIAERNARREAESSGTSCGEIIDGEFARTAS